jgi:predicted MFS family arabinose efflux permease
MDDEHRRGGWFQVAAYAVVCSANQMLWLTFAPVTTVAARHYGVSVSTVGWLAEIFPLLYVVVALPAGVLLDRWFRGWLSVGAVLTAAGALLRLDGGFGRVLLGQVVIAVAQPFVLNALTKVASGYLPERSRAKGIAFSSASMLVGILLSFLLGSLFHTEAQLETLLLVTAGYAVVGGIALPLALRRPGATGLAAVAAGRGALRALWRDPVIRTLAGLLFVGIGLFNALTTWLEPLLEPAGVSTATADVLLLELVVAGVLGNTVLPALAVARRRESHLLVTAMLVSASACAALAAVPGTATAAVAMALVGVLQLTCLPVVLDIAERRAGDAGASAGALLWLSGNLGGILLAVTVQALVHRPVAAFVVMGTAALCAVPLARRGHLGLEQAVPEALPLFATEPA